MNDIEKIIKNMRVEPISKDFTDRVMRKVRERKRRREWIFAPILAGSLFIGIITGVLLFQKKSETSYVISNESIISEIVYEGNNEGN